MNTLVIHPDDRSTDFLRPIYKDIKNVTLVTGECSQEKVIEYIKQHDKVLMMGHGSPEGLFGYNFKRPFIIDSNCVEALRLKDKNVMYLWCHANKFVERYNLKGFYSGMFISEVSEAHFCGLTDTTQEQVTISNSYFANICGSYINESFDVFYGKVKEQYAELIKNNPVIGYNCSRLRISI